MRITFVVVDGMEDGSIRSPFACSLRDENHLQVLQRIDKMAMAVWRNFDI
jgi:hypothetical protein